MRYHVAAAGILTTLALLTPGLAASARAQTAAPTPQLFASAADVTALIEKARGQIKTGQPMVALPIVQVAPYRANLEYRVAVGPASVHDKEAEMFLVLEGSGTVVTGGTLKDERRTNPDNRSGSGIDGGSSRNVAKGDFILVPEGTGHWFSAINGTLVLMSIHLPRVAR
jgi:mannose-6-phosphate isomerase-like protein (cupin superfamily)